MTAFAPALALLLAGQTPEPNRAELGFSIPATQAAGVRRPERNLSVPVAHAAGVLLAMRVAVSVAQPEGYDPTRLGDASRHLRLAYTQPPAYRSGRGLRGLLQSDGSPLWLNTIGHGAFGSEIYGRTRQCGGAPWTAFLAAAATSTVWEYGVESMHQRPSAIDLVWTPVVGGLLGEGRFRLHRWLARRGSSAWLRFLVDPMGETERRAFGARC